MLALDGAYELTVAGPRFRAVASPAPAELEALLARIVRRIARHLDRRGLLVRDAENSCLDAAPDADDGLATLLGHSITYRIAVRPNEGRKAFTLQTVAPALSAPAGDERLAKHSGFSLHAGVAAAAHQHDKVERLCRYIARPPVNTRYRNGTTHVVLEPLDFLARLAALVPRSRVHLTSYHGVFAPHSALRAQVTPAGRGTATATLERSPAERHRAMTCMAARMPRAQGCAGAAELGAAAAAGVPHRARAVRALRGLRGETRQKRRAPDASVAVSAAVRWGERRLDSGGVGGALNRSMQHPTLWVE